jgi:two-component system response regulator FixJ
LEGASVPSSGNSTKWTVLTVIDDPALRASLQFALEVEGFRVVAFASGEQLLAMHPLPENACFILDHIVPRVDGIEIAAALRRRGIECPAILLTTDGHDALRRRAHSAGVTVVEKPLVDNVLAEAIRAAIDTCR